MGIMLIPRAKKNALHVKYLTVKYAPPASVFNACQAMISIPEETSAQRLHAIKVSYLMAITVFVLKEHIMELTIVNFVLIRTVSNVGNKDAFSVKNRIS